MGRLKPVFALGSALNAGMQALLRDWGLRDGRDAMEDGRWLDQYALEWARGLNAALREELDDEAFIERLRGNVARMQRLAAELLAQARALHPGIADQGLAALCMEAAGDEPLLSSDWYAERSVAAAAAT
jgi:hypothetical protein